MGSGKTFNIIPTLINRNLMLYPDRVGLQEVEGNRSYTFAAMKDRANRMGNALAELGVKKGERVAIMSQNSMEYAEACFYIPNAGFIFVVTNFRLAPPEMAAILTDSEPTVLIVQEQFVALAEKLKENLPSIKHTIYVGAPDKKPAGWLDYEEMIENASPAEVVVEIFEDDVAFLMYTSGTTGLPKGVMQTHANFVHAGRVCSRCNRLTMDDHVAIVCPLFHVTSHYTLFGAFYVAAPSYVYARWDVDLFLSTTEKLKITSGMFATPMVMMILDSPNYKKWDVSSWRSLWFAGAGIIPSTYKKFIDTYGNILGEHHGTTETTGVTTNLSVRDIEDAFERGDFNILESCGRASEDMECLIVDDKGKQVAQPGLGELIVRGPGLAVGYWRKEAETKHAFKGEWFHTEDVCSIDALGYIRVVDRLKDMVITGGENVYPAEVEKVLHSNPAVKESCIIGTPHPTWGEAITAIVVLNLGATITAAEVTAYCKGKIAGYKVPRVVHFVEALPRSASGKIQKVDLRKQFRGEDK
ncbi:MAG: AMP-binding protein [Deltaproteobacteria bacterium]|nr:AMP-binding protein [Deltaproteobacteria bacterium]